MTDTQWLLDLVEEATPGLWRASQDSANAGREPCGAVIAGSNAVVCVGGGKHNPDMRLIALAPDLARLCVELHEALEAIRQRDPIDLGYVQFVQHAAYAALAHFAELKP